MDWKKFAEAYNTLLDVSQRNKSKFKSTDILLLKNSLRVFGDIYSEYLEWNSIHKAEELETEFREAVLRDQVSRLYLLLRRKGIGKEEIQCYLYVDFWCLNNEGDLNPPSKSGKPCFSPPYNPCSLNVILEKGAIENEGLNKFLEDWLRLNYWVEQQLRKQVQNWIRYEDK